MAFLRACHRDQPFLQFNGNVFAEFGRKLTDVLFADLPPNRRREVTSAVSHFIAGVLDQDDMIGIVEGMVKRVDFKVGIGCAAFVAPFTGSSLALKEKPC